MKKYRFRNWLRNWINNFDSVSPEAQGKVLVARDENIDADPMVLKVYRANGGTIIETRKYDRLKDRSHNQLHIITHDQDLGDSIGKIITMESLRG